MDRRAFLGSGVSAGLGACLTGGAFLAGGALWSRREGDCDVTTSLPEFAGPQSCVWPQPAAAVVPVVGDGHWIWTEPPKDKTGYLEPREFTVRVGVEMQGTGNVRHLKAATTVPVECPEQTLEDFKLETSGCEAIIRTLAPGAAQLIVSAASLSAGQVLRAVATFYFKLYKQYHHYERERFAYPQKAPNDVRKAYLQDSPGIQTSARAVTELARQLSADAAHPWDQARVFAEWVPENIEARMGPYTSVTAALKDRVGDCEERAAVFVALCRSVGIPARLVWVPNHNWAEFYLHDADGVGSWIPAHTSCYSWFGWTGVHELVLQKGDRLEIPERSKKRLRLFEDWAQWSGARPRLRWVAEMFPTAREGEDAGPGTRTKDAKGEWVLTGTHPVDKIHRR